MKKSFETFAVPIENPLNILMETMAEKIANRTIERISLHLAMSESVPQQERTRIRGIRGLASYLGIGLNKAQNLKNDRVIPYYEDGGLLFFYSDEVDAALRKGGVK